MNVEITGRHAHITEDIQDYARRKTERITKFLKDNARVEVVLDHDHDQYQAEMIVSGHRGPVVVGHVSHEDPRAAVDLTVDKVEKQLRKLKGRRKDHHGQSMAGEDLRAAQDEGPGDDLFDEDES